jgi:Flp pilus assembly protein TadG
MGTGGMKRSRWTLRARRGGVLLLTVFFLVVLLAIVALSVDVGYLMLVRTELQRSADAAALAAANELIDLGELEENSDPTATYLKAQNAARLYTSRNPAGGQELVLPANEQNAPEGDLVLGRLSDSSGQFDTTAQVYNAVKVRVRRDSIANGRVPLFFAPVIHCFDASVVGEAAAFRLIDVNGFRVASENINSKLLPFAVQIDTWLAATTMGPDDYSYDSENSTVTGGADNIREASLFPTRVGSGNFGTVDVGNPNNSTADLSRQILKGPNQSDFSYFPNSTLELSPNGTLVLQGDTGLSAGIKNELAGIIGQPRAVPLYSTVSGNGNNAQYTIVGFAGMTILHVKLTGPQKQRHITIQPAIVIDESVVGGGENGVTSKYVRGPVGLVPF